MQFLPKMEKSAAMRFIAALAILLVVVFYIGTRVGHLEGARSVVPDGEGRVVNQGSTYRTDDVNFNQFWEVWNLVKDKYVKQPVSEIDLYYGALRGLLEGLGDEHSVYFDPNESQAFLRDLDMTFSGIGAEIDEKDDYIIVVAPLRDSPAERAGLLTGDVIMGVDGVETYQMSVQEAVSKIRGDKGTDVVLTIMRTGRSEAFDVTITRDDIHIDSVEWEMRNDGIAVITISTFNEEATMLFEQAVQEILTKNVRGIVLDVRNNPGGLLTESINIAGFWLGNQTAVVERVQGIDRELNAVGTPRLQGIPTVVLVNGGSASASEILAGALQDYDYAHVIGEQTYGKGSVQEYHEFGDGSALKITIAQWLTPNRRSIQDAGITPDEIVEFTLDQFNAGKTPQLDAAIRYLKAAR